MSVDGLLLIEALPTPRFSVEADQSSSSLAILFFLDESGCNNDLFIVGFLADWTNLEFSLVGGARDFLSHALMPLLALVQCWKARSVFLN